MRTVALFVIGFATALFAIAIGRLAAMAVIAMIEMIEILKKASDPMIVLILATLGGIVTVCYARTRQLP